MSDKKKNIICFILIEVVTAVFFLIIGSLLPFIFGVAHTRDTVVEYVPVKYTITSTTTATTTTATTANDDAYLTTAATTQKTPKTTKSTKVSEKETEPTQVAEKINLNTATMEELMTIKGIGETYARRIIEFREAIGGFTYMEQLKEVEGIGEGRYNAWTPYLTLGD